MRLFVSRSFPASVTTGRSRCGRHGRRAGFTRPGPRFRESDRVSRVRRQVANSLSTLQACLSNMMNETITMEQLRREMGVMIEKITLVMVMLRSLGITKQEYVCLKVIARRLTAG